MDLIKMLLASIGTSMLSRQCLDEFKAWTPWLVRKLIWAAVRQLPEDRRERMREEWSGHASDVPGELGKIFVACGFIWAAVRISAPTYRANITRYASQLGAMALAFVLIVMAIPAFGALCAVSYFCARRRSGSILQKYTARLPNGRLIPVLCLTADVHTAWGRVLRKSEMRFMPLLYNIAAGHFGRYTWPVLCGAGEIMLRADLQQRTRYAR